MALTAGGVFGGVFGSDSLPPRGARTVCEAVRQRGDSLRGSQSLVVGNKMNSAFVRSLCRGFSVFLAFAW